MRTQFKSLYDLFEAIPTEQAAIEHFRAIRWANSAFCPYCGCDRVYHFSDGKTHKCGECRQRFSIKVGTIFEDTKVPLRKWLAAIWLVTSHRKGIASTQLARDIAVTQKTAWFMLHRLRHAARTRSFNRPLKDHVEVDETFVGGREKNKHADKRLNQGRGAVGKTIVMRNGELHAKVVADTKTSTLLPIVRANVAPGANVYTDEHAAYLGLGAHYRHFKVSRGLGEYVKDGHAHTNTLEGAWALLKRQIIGIHHWVSPKHLDRYVVEVVWRYNRRELADGHRVSEFLTRVDGRLRYVDLIAKA